MKFLLAFVLAVSCSAFGLERVKVSPLLVGVTTTATGGAVQPFAGIKTFQVTGTTSAGAGAATIKVEGSATNSSAVTDWVLMCMITLTLSTTSAGDGCVSDADWKYMRMRVTALSGTTATLNGYMSGGAQ